MRAAVKQLLAPADASQPIQNGTYRPTGQCSSLNGPLPLSMGGLTGSTVTRASPNGALTRYSRWAPSVAGAEANEPADGGSRFTG